MNQLQGKINKEGNTRTSRSKRSRKREDGGWAEGGGTKIDKVRETE